MTKHVYLFGYVDIPPDDVWRMIETNPQEVFTPAAEAALDRVSQLVSYLDIDIAGFTLGRTVALEISDSEMLDDQLPLGRLKLRWAAAEHPGLFPSIEADLEVAPLASDETQLSLIGRYHPPLGGAGALVDRMVLHRVAEASLHRFLSRTIDNLEALAKESVDDDDG